MKRRSAWLSFAACALMSAQPVKAAVENKPAATPKFQQAVDFSKVQMVTFRESSNVGFFDNATGTVYIYDATVSKCLAIKKLTTLGAPTQDITN